MSHDADHKREPRLLSGRGGRRMFSIAALAERVREQFTDEYANTDALREANTPSKRMRLLLGVTDYVVAVESIVITSADKAALMQRVYSELFGYGSLDAYLADPNVTTISLNGAERAAVRYGHEDLQEVGPLFEDADHLQVIITRLLLDSGADMRVDLPVIETGLTVGERRISISVVSPSFSMGLTADIRLHPPKAPTLEELVESEVMSGDAAEMLRSLLNSSFGFVIAGEVETGKTTLLNALALGLPEGKLAAVERTGEMRLPDFYTHYQPDWGGEGRDPISFGDRIYEAMGDAPTCLLIDEVRADEPTSIAPLLTSDNAPRQIWSFRGAPDHKRLQSALGMLARRAEVGAGEALVHTMYERLPFVVSVARIKGRLKLFSIAEWQSRVDTDYPDYVQLFRFENGAARRTDAQLARWV